MKHLCIIGLMLVSMLSWAADRSFPANDSRIVYVGRTQVKNNTVAFDWSATYVRVAFTGKKLALHMSDDVCRNFFNVIVDAPLAAEPTFVLASGAKDTVVTLCSFKKSGPHTVLIQKRTEGEQGTTVFHEFITDGVLTQAAALKPRQIEVIGDSYTCGYGAENSGRKDHFTAETESSAKSYAGILARYFDADYVSISHSGMGIARNYNSKFANWYMLDRYLQIFDKDSTAANRWEVSMSAFRPNITIIFLGANDFSVGLQPSYDNFKKHYMQLINEIKANYGEEHPILCCTKKANDNLFAYVQHIVQECGLKNVHYCGMFEGLFHDNDLNLGADFHPNYAAHQKVAHVLVPYVATMTGWELQDKPIK